MKIKNKKLYEEMKKSIKGRFKEYGWNYGECRLDNNEEIAKKLHAIPIAKLMELNRLHSKLDRKEYK